MLAPRSQDQLRTESVFLDYCSELSFLHHDASSSKNGIGKGEEGETDQGKEKQGRL